MRGRFISGLTTGLLFGAAASIMMMPQMDWRTRRKLERTSRRIAYKTGDFFNDMMERSK